MSDSLKDQLLKLGFKQPAREPRPEARSGKSDRRSQPHKTPRTAREQGKSAADIDLAKAYAIRAQKEKDERLAAERQKQEEARQRREARAALTALLEKERLNLDNAEIARHFEYGGKIRRIHVSAEQLRALNAGELAVVQLAGRYHLVKPETATEAERLMPGSLALSIDPNSPPPEDDYSDPKYQVPDDLMW